MTHALFDVAVIVKNGEREKYVSAMGGTVVNFLWYSCLISVEELSFMQGKRPTAKDLKNQLEARHKAFQNGLFDIGGLTEQYIRLIENPVGRRVLFGFQTKLMERRNKLGWIGRK